MSEHIPPSNHTIPHNMGPPPNLPAPECFMPQYFTVGSTVSSMGGNENYYLIDSQSHMSKPMSMIGTGQPGVMAQHIQQLQQQQQQQQQQKMASSKSSTTSKSCSSTESQKIIIKNLIQQTNHCESF